MKKIKLLIITPIFPSINEPGHAPFMENLVYAYKSQGLDVEVLAKSGRSKSLFQKIFSYGLFFLKVIFKKTSGYDLIQISFPTLVYPALFFKSFKGTFVFTRFHGEDLVISRKGVLGGILKKFSNSSIIKSDLIVVPSKYFESLVRSVKKDSEIYVYPSGGVDLKKFYPKKMKEKTRKLSIGYVGRLSKNKGLPVLINALKEIDIYYELHVIGDGPDKREMFEVAKVSHVNLKYHGPVPNGKLVDFYNLFDIFVFPTTRKAESFGNVGIEAMACGIPVIGSNIGGITEYLIHEYNGFTFLVNDNDDLRQRILQYFNMSDRKKEKFKENAIATSRKFETSFLTQEFVNTLKGKI